VAKLYVEAEPVKSEQYKGELVTVASRRYMLPITTTLTRYRRTVRNCTDKV